LALFIRIAAAHTRAGDPIPLPMHSHSLINPVEASEEAQSEVRRGSRGHCLALHGHQERPKEEEEEECGAPVCS